jgi:hypothetical protein
MTSDERLKAVIEGKPSTGNVRQLTPRSSGAKKDQGAVLRTTRARRSDTPSTGDDDEPGPAAA